MLQFVNLLRILLEMIHNQFRAVAYFNASTSASISNRTRHFKPLGNCCSLLGSSNRTPKELLAESIGYLWIPGFAGGTQASQAKFADALHRITGDLDARGSCGWIVDLRDNTGGNLWPMLAGVGPVLGDGDAGASVYPDGRRVTLWYRDGRAGFGDYVQLRVAGAPYRLDEPYPPTAVIVGPSTASSGEVIAAAFRGRKHASIFGAATRGLSTGNRTFPLSDGAALVLTVAATSDRTGRVYNGARFAVPCSTTESPSSHEVTCSPQGESPRWRSKVSPTWR